jgi:hypothetical protein
MPQRHRKPYPPEFREQLVALVRARPIIQSARYAGCWASPPAAFTPTCGACRAFGRFGTSSCSTASRTSTIALGARTGRRVSTETSCRKRASGSAQSPWRD